MLKRIRLVGAALIGLVGMMGAAHAGTALNVYGPGGPAPAMKEAAAAFEQKTGTKVTVTAGPTPKWIDQAKADADVVYGGSETMMTDFVTAMDGRIQESEVQPMYLRPYSILVRPGNPKKIAGVRHLLKPGVNILVVNGAGQTGAWEDMAGRKGDIKTVRAIRKNIVGYAKNSAEARQKWIDDSSIDAWLIWNIWEVSNPDLADVVKIESDYAIYRDSNVVVTTQGKTNPAAQQFVDFLFSPEGARIFKKWGWMS
ncbi:MAG: extracellular solute-binding protein [Sulfuriferula multivorans]|uniref:Extracellular solute-binding protein n=1 Tax=Sulfuriferula multivorans TaxID=1559896 RepID=A0A7C9TAB5_9PROT|nr:extracellular solute-binding protein [Sulfuriferula multivorans]